MRTILLAFGITLLVAGAAQGAVVRYAVYAPAQPHAGDPAYPVALMNVNDESSGGEANDVQIGYDAASAEVVVHEDGPTPLSSIVGAGGSCRLSADAHEVRCARNGAVRLSASYDLALGDDRAVVGFGPSWQQEVFLSGGEGDDTLELTGNGRISAAGGDDTITLLGSGAEADGGSGDDVMTGGPAADRLFGGAGDDRIDGGGGDDRIVDTGDGSVAYGSDDDTLIGGSGADTIISSAGSDHLDGGPGYDHLLARDATAAPGADVLDCAADGGTYDVDADDATTGCGEPCPYATCGVDRPLGGPGSFGGGGGGGASGTGSGAAPTPVPVPAAEPVAAEAGVASTVAPPTLGPSAVTPLTVRFDLDAARARLPLHRLPRGLITLSSTADVTVSLARERAGGWRALPGSVVRRLGVGERNITLARLLGSSRRLAGLYRLTVSAVTIDGRRASATVRLRLLARRGS